MFFLDKLTLKIKRGEGPVYSSIRRFAKKLLHSNLPVPGVLKPLFRLIYQAHFSIRYLFLRVINYFYVEPLFRSRCESVGANLHVWLMPHVSGHTKIYFGKNVSLYGHLGVGSGRVFDDPTFRVGDGVDIGHNVFISVNKEVVIEDEVNIASNVYIQDNDGHPRDAELRAQKAPPDPEEVRPIRICKRAWIGQGSCIMKGVTIGEGAIIGTNSVVITDIPPYSVALGNPARVVIKDVRSSARPAAESRVPAPSSV